ncbi:MAG: hypothetical protein JXA64_01665 [Candidatus Fermentibacteraceae bacterium]|nr:hypothetical protein [Candidatus Fermentibacteraceae bacterium]MBN2607794.1 hypothetical protein [Candidatus Fermentibacteraceae bacterium]
MSTALKVEIAWLNQPGRHLTSIASLADGFTGTGAIAGVAVVAEGPPLLQGFIGDVVALLRDTFAEGVAYGIGDLLEDSIEEVDERPSAGEISLAVAAALGSEVWVYSRGSCRVFITGRDPDDGVLDDAAPGEGARHLLLKPGQSVILMTEGVGRLVRSDAAESCACGCRRPLDDSLRHLVEETGIRFRKTGGSAAAVRVCRDVRKLPSVSLRTILYPVLVLLAVLAAVTMVCHGNGDHETPVNSGAVDTSETVMPLD